ncbi:hypothetical protein WA158_004519 [Blastocystis sp. Blastoise]
MSTQSIRLYVNSVFLGYKRSQCAQYSNTSLLKIDGVQSRKAADFYLGKRVAYVYRAHNRINGSKIRCIWGKITKTHGTNGTVRAKNLPPQAMGKTVRVMLYPSSL